MLKYSLKGANSKSQPWAFGLLLDQLQNLINLKMWEELHILSAWLRTNFIWFFFILDFSCLNSSH